MTNINLFSISAAAAKAGTCTDTLRRYADDGIIHPVRDSSGRRLFSDGDITKAREHRQRTIKNIGDVK